MNRKYLSVMLASILKNANIDDDIYFYILDGGIEENNKIKILELNKIKKCNIYFISHDKSYLKDFAI